MHNLTLAQLAAALRAKQFSSLELTRHFLARIKQPDGAPLLGVPFAQKDIFCTAGGRTSCGSKMLDNFVAPYDATVVSKLTEAGTVMLGKTGIGQADFFH